MGNAGCLPLKGKAIYWLPRGEAGWKGERIHLQRYEEWLTREGLDSIEGWAREGLNDREIAERMGVKASSLSRWKGQFAEVAEALAKGRAGGLDAVERALLRCALGHVVPLRKAIKLKEVSQKGGEGRCECERVEYVEEQEYVQPRLEAIRYLLEERRGIGAEAKDWTRALSSAGRTI